MGTQVDGGEVAHHNDEAEKVALLSEMGLFVGFTEEELKRVANLTQMVHFRAGQVIVDQGDPGVDCYLIADGRANVYVRGEYVTTSAAGSMIGEMALIDKSPPTATVRARSDCRVVPIDEARFMNHVHRTPFFAIQVMRIMNERLRRRMVEAGAR